MHSCLNVDEIVRLIAYELVASGGKGSAVGLACCCESFKDPVLDALWATQDQLRPLLKSLPGDVWKGGYRVSVPTIRVFFSSLNDSIRKSFKRLPTKMEWTRFWKYARRMRRFTHFDAPSLLSLEVFSVIQLCTANEPLFPNLKMIDLWGVRESFIPFIPLLLSLRTTLIVLKFESNLPEAMVASIVTALPTLCPNLQTIRLYSLPRDPMVTAAVSGMLVTNRNTLQEFDVDCPLTEEASEVLYKLSDLRSLSVVIERETLLPPASLPNLTDLEIICDDEDDWPQLFHGATFGKLEAATFYPHSEQLGDLLGAFERAALSSSVQYTLSSFYLSTSCSWSPNYSSLLPFVQLVDLEIEFSCHDGCSSRVDDDIVTSLSRAMPKLNYLKLGDAPCRQITTGVTTKGLVALARHCPDLSILRIHFQVASLSIPLASPGMTPNTESTALWTGCALTCLYVGAIPVPEESVLMVSLALLHLFPQIEKIYGIDEGWEKVKGEIYHSRGIIDCSSKQCPLTTP